MNKTNASLELMLKELKLGSFVKNYQDFAAQAGKGNLPYEEFLRTLVAEELAQRIKNKIRRLIAGANFPPLKTLAEFQFEDTPDLNNQSIIQLADCHYIEQARNICFLGQAGVGKSHLAMALGYEACKRKYPTIFISAAKLVNELIEAKKGLILSKVQKKYTHFKLIIIDELGYIPFSKDGAQHLFQFFADCYEKQSIIVTTNLEFSKWTEFLGDPVMTSALLDRFTHHCDIFPINAESYRFKNRGKS
jgi:DNA replication protein DnaC